MSVNCSRKWKAQCVPLLVSSSHFANSTSLYFWDSGDFLILSAGLVSKSQPKKNCNTDLALVLLNLVNLVMFDLNNTGNTSFKFF